MTELEPEPGLLAPNPVLFLLHITTIKKKIPPTIKGLVPEVATSTKSELTGLGFLMPAERT